MHSKFKLKKIFADIRVHGGRISRKRGAVYSMDILWHGLENEVKNKNRRVTVKDTVTKFRNDNTQYFSLHISVHGKTITIT